MGAPEKAPRPSLEWDMFFLALLIIPLIVIQLSSEDPEVLLATTPIFSSTMP